MVTPVAAIYMLLFIFNGSNSFLSAGIETDLLLIGAGAATAVPLFILQKEHKKFPYLY